MQEELREAGGKGGLEHLGKDTQKGEKKRGSIEIEGTREHTHKSRKKQVRPLCGTQFQAQVPGAQLFSTILALNYIKLS